MNGLSLIRQRPSPFRQIGDERSDFAHFEP
jgi:hypothetical protein